MNQSVSHSVTYVGIELLWQLKVKVKPFRAPLVFKWAEAITDLFCKVVLNGFPDFGVIKMLFAFIEYFKFFLKKAKGSKRVIWNFGKDGTLLRSLL